MAITTFDTIIERIPGVAKTYALNIHSTEPGDLAITYPTGITGPATATVAGTRTWRNGLCGGYCRGWNGPSGASAATQARDGVTICFDIDLDLVNYGNFTTIDPEIKVVAQNYLNGSVAASQHAWKIGVRSNKSTAPAPILTYTQTSNLAGTSAGFSQIILNSASIGRYCRCCLTLNGTAITLYYNDGVQKYTLSTWRVAPVGSLADPVLAIVGSARFAYFSSILANDATGVDAWLAGDCPANPVVYYPCGEEVPDSIAAAPYDAGANGYDGVFNGDATYPLTKAPRVYTDTTPVIPYVTVPIVIAADCAAGDHTITITRARQGVPARASDEEKYETATLVVTVVDLPITGSVGPAITKRAKL